MAPAICWFHLTQTRYWIKWSVLKVYLHMCPPIHPFNTINTMHNMNIIIRLLVIEVYFVPAWKFYFFLEIKEPLCYCQNLNQMYWIAFLCRNFFVGIKSANCIYPFIRFFSVKNVVFLRNKMLPRMMNDGNHSRLNFSGKIGQMIGPLHLDLAFPPVWKICLR